MLGVAERLHSHRLRQPHRSNPPPVDSLITNNGAGNPELCNLPRKLNISFSASRDDFVHSHINDLAFEAAVDDAGVRGWNVMVGGYLSIKRCATSIPFDTFVTDDQVVDFARAFLIWFREHGARTDRQKARVLWLVERVGVDAGREAIAALMPGQPTLARAAPVTHEGEWTRRDVLGVHDQIQPGLRWVGACIPVGRLSAADFDDIAAAAEAYGEGTVRCTVDENVVFPNVPVDRVDAMLAEPLFERFVVPSREFAPMLTTALVSCTGAQFCGLALAETKAPLLDIVRKLDSELALKRPVRIHVTGCPNSCGQAQAGDIGLIGAPAKKEVDGKKVAVQGEAACGGGGCGGWQDGRHTPSPTLPLRRPSPSLTSRPSHHTPPPVTARGERGGLLPRRPSHSSLNPPNPQVSTSSRAAPWASTPSWPPLTLRRRCPRTRCMAG